MPTAKTTWQCNYCNKRFTEEENAIEHEENCFLNIEWNTGTFSIRRWVASSLSYRVAIYELSKGFIWMIEDDNSSRDYTQVSERTYTSFDGAKNAVIEQIKEKHQRNKYDTTCKH